MQSVFRKDVEGKLPFLKDPRKLAAEAVRDLLTGLESKLGPAIKDPAGALTNSSWAALAVCLDLHRHVLIVVGGVCFADKGKELDATAGFRHSHSFRGDAGVSVAMANNVRYIVVIVEEHEQLSSVLGRSWLASMEERMDSAQEAYFQETWQPVVGMLTQLLSDMRSEVCCCCLMKEEGRSLSSWSTSWIAAMQDSFPGQLSCLQ